ncbi:MAG: triose-phosphate isomerase [Desulfovibrionaceae bacterium]|nr:triose-phosphate isomerase [Desulfovibrionaceae bacterium]
MKTIIAANWKMHKTRSEAAQTAASVATFLGKNPMQCSVLIFAPFTALGDVAEQTAPNLAFGAQNMYPADHGAYTGEISPDMILDCGCQWVLTGHSERRRIFREDDAFIGKKTAFALRNGLSVMLCIGETLEERRAGQLRAVLSRQLLGGFADPLLNDVQPDRLAVAYEPVWAIGTGVSAKPEDAMEAHGIIREELISRFGSKGQDLPILYGGSVKPENSEELLKLDNVNGLLVGGASLEAESFIRIIRIGSEYAS